MKRLILLAVDAESELAARQIAADFSAFLSATGEENLPTICILRATANAPQAVAASDETTVIWVLCYRHTARDCALDMTTLLPHSGYCLLVNVDLDFPFHSALQKRAQACLGKECRLIEIPKITATETHAIGQQLADCLNWQPDNAAAVKARVMTFESSIDVLRVAALLNFPLTEMYDTLRQTFAATIALPQPLTACSQTIEQLRALLVARQESQEIALNKRRFVIVCLLLCCANARGQKHINIECYQVINNMIDEEVDELRPLQQFIIILLAELNQQNAPTQAYAQLQQLGQKMQNVEQGQGHEQGQGQGVAAYFPLLEGMRLLVLMQVLDALGRRQEKEQCADALAQLVEKLSSDELAAIGVQSFAKIHRLRKTMGDIL